MTEAPGKKSASFLDILRSPFGFIILGLLLVGSLIFISDIYYRIAVWR